MSERAEKPKGDCDFVNINAMFTIFTTQSERAEKPKGDCDRSNSPAMKNRDSSESERAEKPKGDCDIDAIFAIDAIGPKGRKSRKAIVTKRALPPNLLRIVLSPKGRKSRKAIVTTIGANNAINTTFTVRKGGKAERRL